MNLFEETVNAVLAKNQEFSVLRPAVEKEIFHMDILRTLSKAGFLQKLTFMGGTCLRYCYGFARLSEDLDFTGGFNFKKKDLGNIGELIKESIRQKYQLTVEVLDPAKEDGNTHTWKIKIITAPQRNDLPQQKINIDVCILPSYERQPVMIKNHYGINMGSSGLIVMAESLREILADKIIALAMRPNRVKNRDLWDIYQLKVQNIDLSVDLIKQKLKDRKIDIDFFKQTYDERLNLLKKQQNEFLREMQRFLSSRIFTDELRDKTWWKNLLLLLKEWCPLSF